MHKCVVQFKGHVQHFLVHVDFIVGEGLSVTV